MSDTEEPTEPRFIKRLLSISLPWDDSRPVYRAQTERESIRAAIQRRGITSLYHATFSASLSAISHTRAVSSGLTMVKPPFALPSPQSPAGALSEVYAGHVCLSVRPFWRYMSWLVRDTKNSICLLEIEPEVAEFEGVAFSACFAADPIQAAEELKCTSTECFERMFADSRSSVPINNSAKILVPGEIPVSFIRRVVFAREDEMGRATEINPGNIGPCAVDAELFPDSARADDLKANWPSSADEVEAFWMEFLGLIG